MEHVLPHAATSAAAARRLLRAWLSDTRVPLDVRDDAALVLSELVGNAVRHGSALPGATLRVGWALTGERLRLSVQDGGAGPARRGPRDSGAGSHDGDEDGRGLTIVGLLCAGWGVEDGPQGARVWAELPVVRRAGRDRAARDPGARRSSNR